MRSLRRAWAVAGHDFEAWKIEVSNRVMGNDY